jgi:hypothetical protein
MQRNMGNGAAVGDYNGDGFLDIYLLGQSGHVSRLYRNDPSNGERGTRRFTDVTEAAGLGGQKGMSRVAFFADLDGDGQLDLTVINDFAVGSDLTPSRIYRNNGNGTFTDVTAGSGFNPAGFIVGGASLADFDGHGLPSIYVSYWTEQLNAPGSEGKAAAGRFPGHNRLYRNLGGFHFADVTERVNLDQQSFDSFSSVFADLSGDGLPDIYQTMDNGIGDKFWLNTGAEFLDKTGAAQLNIRGNSMGVAALPDPTSGTTRLYVTNITDPNRDYGIPPGGNAMLSVVSRGSGATFSRTIDLATRDTYWGWGTAWADVNLDGEPDLMVGQGFREFVHATSERLSSGTSVLFIGANEGNLVRTDGLGCDVSGDQRSVIGFDYDRDGAEDFLVTQIDSPPLLLENQTISGNWLTVIPVGVGAIPINATVELDADGVKQARLLLAGGSYLAGPPQEAYFGLGTSKRADVVRVIFADGVIRERHNVTAGQVLRVPHD